MYDINMKKLGENLKKYRKARNMSMQELGNKIGKSKTTIKRYETGEILMDILTAIEICNIFNIDLNDICEQAVQNLENSKPPVNPFENNLLYLYYISKNGIIISSIEIDNHKNSNCVIMKNALISDNKYKQEYTGILESNYNTAFFCLTNAVNNPGLDKFQIEIDLHSLCDNMYFGIFLGVSDNTHRPTARKCILTKNIIKDKEKLHELFEKLKIDTKELQDIANIKYWDLKTSNIKDYVVDIAQ